MTNKDIIKLAHKNNNQNKFKRNILTLTITIILLIILIPFSFYSTYMHFINDFIENYFETKYITIEDYSDDQYKEILNFKKKNEYIIKIEKNYKGVIQAVFKKDNLKITDDAIFILPNIPYNSPNKKLIDKGLVVKNSNEIICPSNMILGRFDDKKLEDGIDMKKHIGKTFDLIFNIYDENYNVIGQVEKSFKLVGTYDANKTYSYNICYIEENYYDEILKEVRLFEPIPQPAIYIKSVKDKEKVTKYLDKIGVTYQAHDLEIDFLYIIVFIALIATIILGIILTIVFIIYIRNYIKEHYKSLTLYKALGFTKNDICKIMFAELLETFIYAMLITLVPMFILSKILQYFLSKTVAFAAFNFRLSYLSIFVFFLITMIIAYFILKSELHSLDKFTVKELNRKETIS